MGKEFFLKVMAQLLIYTNSILKERSIFALLLIYLCIISREVGFVFTLLFKLLVYQHFYSDIQDSGQDKKFKIQNDPDISEKLK